MKRLLLVGLCLLTASAAMRGQSPDQKKAAIAYLQKLQSREGGFLPAANQPQPSVRASTAALRALKYFGGAAPDRPACAAFVKRCFDKGSGGFADRPGGRPDVVTTAVGIMAVVELQIPTEPYADAVVKYLGDHVKTFEDIRIAAAGLEAIGKRPPYVAGWLEQLTRMRNPDGTWGKGDGKARATGGAAVAVLRLGGKVDTEAVLRAVKAGQRSDGGWGDAGAAGSDLGTSYRVLRCFHMLKARPENVRGLRDFIARCRNADGGYGVAPGRPSSASGTYYAAIILHWLDEK